MGMEEYKIIVDPPTIAAVFGNRTPYNLHKDLKDVSKKQVDLFSETIGNCLRTDTYYARIAFSNPKKCLIVKIEAQDGDSKKGKRKGYRCIVLVDKISKRAILLHVFSKSDQSDIPYKDYAVLKKLLSDYEESLEEE